MSYELGTAAVTATITRTTLDVASTSINFAAQQAVIAKCNAAIARDATATFRNAVLSLHATFAAHDAGFNVSRNLTSLTDCFEMDTRDFKNKAQRAIEKTDRSAKNRAKRAENLVSKTSTARSLFFTRAHFDGESRNTQFDIRPTSLEKLEKLEAEIKASQPIRIKARKETDAISDATEAESNKREKLQKAVTTSTCNAISSARQM